VSKSEQSAGQADAEHAAWERVKGQADEVCAKDHDLLYSTPDMRIN